MQEPRTTREHFHAHDMQFENACPTCGGAVAARISPDGAWTWCPACHRLAQAVVAPGPAGPVLLHGAVVV